MDKMLESLDAFIRSKNCVFDFKSIDYPSEFQQHLITSYFTKTDLLKTHSQTDIVRLLHSSEKYLEVFIPGLLYQMLLDPPSASQHFETFMPSLRSESWAHFGKLLLHLLQDSFTWIKPQLRSGIVFLLGKLHYYGQLSGDLLVLAVKTIDYSDMSETSLNFNNEMLGLFQRLLTEPVSKPLTYILAKTLFYKLLRMLSLLNFNQDEGLKEYRMRCIILAQRIFELEREKCLAMGNSGLNILREIQTEQIQIPFLSRLAETLASCNCKPESPQSASMRLSAVLPIKIQTTLLFILRENITKTEIKIQLNWILASNGQFSLFIIPDILRYLLALPPEELTINQCLYILEELFYRVCTNSILFEMLKDELFFSCFADPCPFPAAPERVLRFLAYLLKTNLDFGQTLLVYLLYRYGAQNPEVLQSLLLRANELKILNIDEIINHQGIQPRLKEELVAILDHKRMMKRLSSSEHPINYYDPLEVVNRKESEMSLQFRDSQPNYLESESEKMEAEGQRVQTLSSSFGRVRLEKMFVEDMGEDLSELLKSPSLAAFHKLYRQFLKVIKEFKVDGEQELIQNYISEISKTTYLTFQNQFEEHVNPLPKEESILCSILNIVALEWRVNSFQLQIVKKIVKKLIQLFPTCEPCFWRHFLLNFKRSVVGASRQMKQWLIPRDKIQIVVSMLRELGPVSRQLTESAEQLKLPLYLD